MSDQVVKLSDDASCVGDILGKMFLLLVHDVEFFFHNQRRLFI